MAEILLPNCQFRRLSDGATCRDIQEALCQACTAHVQVAALRTRLENAEAESRQAFEDHQEVCAVVIDLRARLASAEALATELERSSPDADDWRAVVAVRLRAALENANG